jgi:secreted trypsin-like serine protease
MMARILRNPGARAPMPLSTIGGQGGSCFGDSGGPVFINDTNQILAVVSFGFSGTCHGADYSWRVDTVSSQDFIMAFVSA